MWLLLHTQFGLLSAVLTPILDAAGIPLPGLDTVVATDCTDTVRRMSSLLYDACLSCLYPQLLGLDCAAPGVPICCTAVVPVRRS